MKDKIKRLYFLKGMVATDAELAEAHELGISAFRNGVEAARSGATLERADVVAGMVPVAYAGVAGVKIIDPKAAPKAVK